MNICTAQLGYFLKEKLIEFVPSKTQKKTNTKDEDFWQGSRAITVKTSKQLLALDGESKASEVAATAIGRKNKKKFEDA